MVGILTLVWYTSGMEQEQSIAALQERLHLQDLVSEIAAILDDLPPAEVDEEIDKAIQRIVEFLGIDRAGLGEFSEDGGEMTITHAYSIPGVEPVPNVFMVKYLPWWRTSLSQGKVVSMESPDLLPSEAAAEKAYCDRSGLKSSLTIPFSIAGSVYCAIGFSTFRSCHPWPDFLVRQLRRLGEIFAHAVYRRRAQEKIKAQLQFEQLVSELAARFVSTPREMVDQEIEKSLQRLTSFFQIDRLALLKISQDNGVAVVTHTATADGIDRGSLEINYVTRFPWHAAKLLAGETVSIDIKNLPPEAKQDRKSAERMGIRSNLVIPLIVHKTIDFILEVNTVRNERHWDDQIISHFRLLGEIFIHALLRKHSEDELALLKNRLEVEAEYLRSEVEVLYHYEDIVGESDGIRKVLHQIEQVAPTNATVLIQGETGTGKELIARAIHNLSPRKNRAMVKVDCASLPATLIENELFGREKGAYTGALAQQIGRFEVADASTIFLDEVGELSIDLQTKLLRVLEQGEFERLGSTRTIKVDVRVVAATNRNLWEAVNKGAFRQDLYYRLNVFPIMAPTLRERASDIPLLANTFLKEFRKKMGKNIQGIPTKTMETLMNYHWPGNVRELRNVIERGVIISKGSALQIELPSNSPNSAYQQVTLVEYERRYITEVLNKTNWVIKGPRGAANILGLKPSTLYDKMHRLGIVIPKKTAVPHS
jgi:transcriptional regulator with GAF, ATPase, and Fis domain